MVLVRTKDILVFFFCVFCVDENYEHSHSHMSNHQPNINHTLWVSGDFSDFMTKKKREHHRTIVTIVITDAISFLCTCCSYLPLNQFLPKKFWKHAIFFGTLKKYSANIPPGPSSPNPSSLISSERHLAVHCLVVPPYHPSTPSLPPWTSAPAHFHPNPWMGCSSGWGPGVRSG